MVGCGGGDTTTIIQTTPTTAPSTTTSTASVFISDPLGKRSSEPSTLAFSADGDLVGKDLQWSDWGLPTATANGTFLERQPPSVKEVALQGSVEVSNLKSCGDTRYYTRARVTVPPDAPFQPTAINLAPSCGD